jgi:hypothetical protein
MPDPGSGPGQALLVWHPRSAWHYWIPASAKMTKTGNFGLFGNPTSKTKKLPLDPFLGCRSTEDIRIRWS